jgi:predicted transposase/invertase (TIGR01784 family)
VCPGSFVDEALRERFTDLLYSVELAGRPAFLYLLLEHQSTVDHMLVFRLWRYMGDIWQGYLKDHPDARQLPLIVPLVLHHSATGWTAPRAMRELFDLDPELEEAAGAYLPELRFVLDDLSAQADDELRSRVMAALPRLVLWALKNARGGGEVLTAMQAWVAVVREVVQTKGVAALATVLRYIVLVSEIEPASIEAFLAREVGERAREAYMTTAERLEQQGLERGLERGRAEGRVEGLRAVLSKQLQKRFGPLSSTVSERLASATTTELEQWVERVLDASTVEDVFVGPSAH